VWNAFRWWKAQSEGAKIYLSRFNPLLTLVENLCLCGPSLSAFGTIKRTLKTAVTQMHISMYKSQNLANMVQGSDYFPGRHILSMLLKLDNTNEIGQVFSCQFLPKTSTFLAILAAFVPYHQNVFIVFCHPDKFWKKDKCPFSNAVSGFVIIDSTRQFSISSMNLPLKPQWL